MKAMLPTSDKLRDMLRSLKSSGGLFETAEEEAEYDALILADLESACNAVIDAERRHARIKKAAKEALEYLEMVSEDMRARIAKQAAQVPTNGDGKFKLAGRLFSAYLSKSKGRVEVFDDASVPRIFWKRKVVEEPDTALIRSALESGQTVPGARLVGADEKHIVLKVNESAIRELEVESEIRGALE
jgi:hypothetical protein